MFSFVIRHLPFEKIFFKPYSEKGLNHNRIHSNKCLSSARRIVENVFRILANRFSVSHTALGVSLDNDASIVIGACPLHNVYAKIPQCLLQRLSE